MIAPTEMISHEFLNEGHALQRTRFSNGAEVWVNFSRDLPQNGFWAKGPGIEQSRTLVKDRIVTDIQAKDYHFRETERKLVSKGTNFRFE